MAGRSALTTTARRRKRIGLLIRHGYIIVRDAQGPVEHSFSTKHCVPIVIGGLPRADNALHGSTLESSWHLKRQ